MTKNKPRLLDQVKQATRVKHYSLRTEVQIRHHLYDTVVQKEINKEKRCLTSIIVNK